MGQEVLDNDWPSDSLALVPFASSSSSADGSGGLMGGRSDGLFVKNSSSDEDIYSSVSARNGLAGLQNLGNTCFMNSALQCLAHTPELVHYFLQDYSKEINRANPLGMETSRRRLLWDRLLPATAMQFMKGLFNSRISSQGELAEAFGDLMRSLWTSGKASVAPRSFKTKLSHFAPQFSGYNQHDSQELLAFLLDGLHEDLNRVKSKPYIEAKDADGRPDEEVAAEYWRNHKARNDSVIVDLFQGQYKSTLVCPSCRKISVTFDPFMYLSLPLPPAKAQQVNLTFTVFSADGSPPTVARIQTLKEGRMKDILPLLENECNLQEDETLRLAEVYRHHIFKTFTEDLKLDSIQQADRLVAFKLRNISRSAPVLTLYHSAADGLKLFGCPLVTALPEEGLTTGAELYALVERTLLCMKKATSASPREACVLFKLYMTDDKGVRHGAFVDPDEPLPTGFSPSIASRDRYLSLEWSESGLELYDIRRLDNLPEAVQTEVRRPRPVSLYTCLDTFIKEEPLGPDDMWYCPRCKEHRQASKKLDLWRMPEILVVHLKRFSYSRNFKNKLETLVDFPIRDLDISKYVPQEAHLYELFAVSNHFGGMGGGHYTAYAKLCDENKWYTFDDSMVNPMSEDGVQTSAAYVLFYRRQRQERECSNGHAPLLH